MKPNNCINGQFRLFPLYIYSQSQIYQKKTRKKYYKILIFIGVIFFLPKIEVIPVEQIMLFEAQDDYVQIYSDKSKYLKNMTMKYLEAHLNKEIFVRVHRSYIININFIERIEKAEKESNYIIMKNNTVAKASKSGYNLLKEKLDL